MLFGLHVNVTWCVLVFYCNYIRAYPYQQANLEFSVKHLNQNCMVNVAIFILDKFISAGNYLLLSGRYIGQHLHFVNGKNNGFTTDDWQEKHIFV